MAYAKILIAENFYCSILQPSVILIARHHTEEIFGRQKAKDREWFNILQHARELELFPSKRLLRCESNGCLLLSQRLDYGHSRA